MVDYRTKCSLVSTLHRSDTWVIGRSDARFDTYLTCFQVDDGRLPIIARMMARVDTSSLGYLGVWSLDAHRYDTYLTCFEDAYFPLHRSF